MINQNQSYLKRCRKAIAAISLLCLLFAFSAVTASAAGASAKIEVSSCTVERGAAASVAFRLEENPGIWGIKLRIHYDHSAFTLQSVTTGSVFEKGELTLSQNLDKDPYVVVASANSLENKTANGAVVTLNFAVSSTAEWKAYPVTVEVSQANNVDGNKINVASVDGSITVVSCTHASTEWRLTKAASCEAGGQETRVCKKCEKAFETRSIHATGHQSTEVRGAVAATETAAGYTGDTYCKACGKLIQKGQATANLKPNTPAATSSVATSSADTPTIISGNEAIYDKNSQEPLVFVSNADFSEFLYVEMDGKLLDEAAYTAESGSTIITVSRDYLNQLSSGEHTISIVSASGTATAQFTVLDSSEAAATNAEFNSSINTEFNSSMFDSDAAGNKASVMPKALVVVFVVLVIGGAAAFLVIKIRRG